MSSLKEDKTTLKPMITLFKAHKSLVEFIKEDIKNTSFDINEFAVFEIIYHKEKISVSEIKDKVLIANSSLSYILKKLENKSLIKRIKDKNDKRINYIMLTEKGIIEAENIFPNHYNNLKEIFNYLTNDEKDLLIKLTKKIGIHTEEVLK